MKKIVLTKQIKAAEKELIDNGVDEFQLTLRAVSGMLERLDLTKKYLIVTGSGNNAGDGYLLALKLKEKGVFVQILSAKQPKSQTAKYFSGCCVKENIPVSDDYKCVDLSMCDVIIDAVFGNGFKGEIPTEFKMLFDFINNSGKYVVAVDVPSGLDSDTGLVGGVICDKALTIGELKPGLFLNRGKDYVKKFELIDIGLHMPTDTYLFESEDCGKYLDLRKNFSNKGDFGYVAVMGGCENYVGAIKLSTTSESAVCSGAGVSRLIVPSSLKPAVMELSTLSTLCYIDDKNGQFDFNSEQLKTAMLKINTLAFGMGIGLGLGAEKCLRYVLENYSVNLIIDADGLTLLKRIGLDILNKTACRVVLTPHLGEFSKLTGESVDNIVHNLLELSQSFAKKYNVVLLLKGPSTIICDGVKTNIVSRGCSGMATAGSGDVLSGILCGIIGFNGVSIGSVSTACYINGVAGELASSDFCNISMTSLDTLTRIKTAIKQLAK